MTPTITSVATNIANDIGAGLRSPFSPLKKSFLQVLSKTLGAKHVLLHKYAGWMLLQVLGPAHASFRETTIGGVRVRPLVMWGRLIGVGDPNPAVRAEHVLTVTVLDESGELPAGQTLVRQSTGVTYTTINPVALDASTVQVTVRATSDQTSDEGDGAGTIGNLEVGSELTFLSVTKVSPVAVVASRTVEGVDAETEQAYRRRVIRRFQHQPEGGAAGHLEAWAEEATGVARAFVYLDADRPWEVVIYVEAIPSVDADGVPTATEIAAAKARVDMIDPTTGKPSRRPVSMPISYRAITRTAFDVLVAGLIVDDVPAAQTAINAAIDEHLRSLEPESEGTVALPVLSRVVEASVGRVVNDVVDSIGGSVNAVSLFRDGEAIQSWTLQPGEVAKLAPGGCSFT